MGYRSLRHCVRDLERSGQLLRIAEEVDPYLEVAEIQRRVYAAQGPAVLYTNVRGCRFPLVSNLFGTLERTRFLFRDALRGVQKLVVLKVDPSEMARHPWQFRDILGPVWGMRPKRRSRGPVLQHETTLDQLPQIQSWPDDGGAFITLPAVYSEHPDRPGVAYSNLGMYRVQLSGGRYAANRQVGLHYQIHRGLGVHHAAAIARKATLPVNVFVGGPPSLILGAVMPLPEGLAEMQFVGALGRRRARMVSRPGLAPIFADADFCICGTVPPDEQLPEGPFGDHLGYYSLVHDFPVLNVEHVFHRSKPIWPFTTVGRPPQEDTSFGAIIHEITGQAIPAVLPGVHAVHAVDAAGVHPLLLAIGSERYVPYAARRQPQELLTCANAILGQGQLSLAKYLLIVAREDDPQLDIHDMPAFFRHLLERVDWERDLHFQTRTTMDTLDYSGSGLNAGSKVVIAAAGPPRRSLPTSLSGDVHLPDGFTKPRLCLPGIVAIQGPPYAEPVHDVSELAAQIPSSPALAEIPLIVVVDDSEFTSTSLNNLLWVTFTRSDPASDIRGVAAFVEHKHWGCRGALIIDARIKPHHAPPLIEHPDVTRRVDELAAPGRPLHGVI